MKAVFSLLSSTMRTCGWQGGVGQERSGVGVGGDGAGWLRVGHRLSAHTDERRARGRRRRHRERGGHTHNTHTEAHTHSAERVREI